MKERVCVSSHMKRRAYDLMLFALLHDMLVEWLRGQHTAMKSRLGRHLIQECPSEDHIRDVTVAVSCVCRRSDAPCLSAKKLIQSAQGFDKIALTVAVTVPLPVT